MLDLLLENATLLAIGVFVFILATYVIKRISKRKQAFNTPPGPKGVPLYGNLLEFKRSEKRGPGILDRWAAQYGDVYSLHFGPYPAVVLSSREAIREAFLKHGDPTSGRPVNVFFFRYLIRKAGILVNDGQEWRDMRRTALHSLRDFGMGKKSLETRIQDEAQALCDVIGQKESQPFDPHMLLHSAFSNVICSIIFGDSLWARLHRILDLFVAGSETSTTSLRWALLYLLHYPEVQARCQRDIREVIGQARAPTNNDRQKLPYVEATIYEVQRLGAIVPYGVLHRAMEDVTVGGYTIPRDTLLISNLYHLHMDPDYWRDPQLFRPERWLTDDGKLRKHDNYMPFSTGPRECMGKALALQEMFIILVALLQKFTFEPKDPQNLPKTTGKVSITHAPENYELVAVRC